MKVDVVLFNDRHIDPIIEVHTDPGVAIASARAMGQEEATRYHQTLEERDIDGLLYYGAFSCEGDDVIVQEVDLTN